VTGTASLTVNAIAQLNAGAITTTGAQTYNNDVMLVSDTALNASALTFMNALKGDGNLASNVTVNANSGDVTFNGNLGQTGALLGTVTLNTAGSTYFNAPVLVGAIVTNSSGVSSGNTYIHTGAISTTGAQTYNNPVLVQTDTLMSGAVLTFKNTVVGNTSNRRLVLNAQNSITFNSPITMGHLETGATGKTYFNSTTATTTGTSSMFFGNDVVVSGSTFTFDSTAGGALSTGANITFNKTLSAATSGATAVTVDAGTLGSVKFLGDAGKDASGTVLPLSSLTVTAGGGIVIGGGYIQTTGAQTYNSPITLSATVTLQADQLTWGTVTATAPHVGLSLVSQGAQVLTDISLTGDLTVTTGVAGVVGGVTQAAGSALSIGGASTFFANTKVGQVAELSSAANNFVGAVSLRPQNGGSWDRAAVVSASPLVIGTTTVSGDVSIKSTGGNITQEGPLVVGGKTDMVATAGGLNLTDPGNSFLGVVNINTSNGLSLTTSGPLTIGNIKTVGDTVLTTVGKIDLGTSSFGGKLKVDSGGFEIMQSGPGNFAGDTNFQAGTAKIDLFNPNNLWKGSIVYKGGIVMINHPQLLNATNAGTLIVRIETTMSADSQKVSTPAATQASSASAQPAGPSTSADVTVSVARPSTSLQGGLVSVAVSAETVSAGKGFAFSLTEHIPADVPKATQVAVTQLDGKALPEWLRYDAKTKKVVATSPPPGAFPIQIKASMGGVETVIVITEQPK
jgi:Repeats of unknown function (DUF5649)